MMSVASACKALVIASTADAAESVAVRLRALGQEDLRVDSVPASTAEVHLERLRAAQQEPDVICIDIQCRHLRIVTQALAKLEPTGEILFLYQAGSSDAARQKVELLPLSRLHWTLWCDSGTEAKQLLADACARSRKRDRYQRRLNQGMSRRSGAQHGQDVHKTPISDYYLNHFLAQAQEAIVAVDTQGRVLFWSGGANRLFSLHQDAVIGAAAETLPFWTPALRSALAEAAASGQATSIQMSFPQQDPSLELEITCSTVLDQSRGMVGSSLVIRDITERQRKLDEERERDRRIRAALMEERRKLLRLFAQAPGFVAVTEGPDHIFQVVNEAYLRLVGRESLIGNPARQALPEMQGQKFLALFDLVYKEKKGYVGRGMPLIVRPQSASEPQTRYLDFVFEPIIEDDGEVSGVFCQGADVTEQKLAQDKLEEHRENLEQLVEARTQELQSSQEALQRSQKLEAIGKLTGGVAHDFNNVLQIIAGNLQLLELQQQRDGYGAGRDFVSASLEAVSRGRNLSSQLLSFARRQPLRPAVTNLGKLIRSMDHLLRRVLGEAIEVETVVAGGLWNTLVDPHQLENVILNLAINAQDAMPEGGKLTLELGNALLDEHYVHSEPDVPPGQYVMLAVSDTGVGMSKEVKERIFEPFFTTKKEGEGTGLGLSMAYGFTKQSGGHIKVYSEQGAGTTFRIYLPRSFEAEERVTRHRRTAIKGGSERILVVEDDDQVRKTVVHILQDLGYQVLQAQDGASAFNVLQSGVHIDLLFTDVVMPGPLRSPDLAKKAVALYPHIKVLFTSGYTQNAIVHGGRLDPGVELLGKPYGREDLARKVRAMLDADDKTEAAKDAEPQPNLRILFVEDEADSRSAVSALLESLGHQVTSVGSAEEALRQLEGADFDVLLTDVSLPGISGLALVERALKQHRKLRTIVASGYGEQAAAGLNNSTVWLSKPFGLNALQAALESALKLPILE